MKKFFVSSVAVFSFFFCFAQGMWIQKSPCPTAYKTGVSFTISGIGYYYTGDSTSNFYKYDPNSDIWTPLVDFPGAARFGAAGFATSTYGYVGSGFRLYSPFTAVRDFYQYDPVANTWSAKQSYPDTVAGAYSFCINDIGYFASGTNTYVNSTKCYQYLPASDQWIQKSNIPLGLDAGFSAVVNSKAYCGLGRRGNLLPDSIFEYDPVLDLWQTKSHYRLDSTQSARGFVSFVLNNKIYIAAYKGRDGLHGEVEVYDPVLNSWSAIPIFPYPSWPNCNNLVLLNAFELGGKGYFGGFSCQGTGFWVYDPNDTFTINSVSPGLLCERDSVNVTISSSLTFNSGNTFKVQFNGKNYPNNASVSGAVAGTQNGTYTFKVPHTIYGLLGDTIELSVLSSSPFLQTQNLNQKVVLGAGPAYGFDFTPSFDFCTGSTMVLYRGNVIGTTYSWTSNPQGITGSSYSLSISPTQNVTIYSHEVSIAGCVLDDSTYVNIIAPPPLNISDSAIQICQGSSVALGGTPATNGSYVWTGPGLNSTAVNPTVSPTANTSYSLDLTDTVTGCKSTLNVSVDMAQSPTQSICFVTVDSNSSHNVIVWEKTDKYATDSFYIYREISTNNYSEIGAVHRDSLSEYHDYAANPNVTAYRYKISVKDTCGHEGTISHYHNTIHLQYLGMGNLIWNVYQIENETTPVSTFDVFIDSLANGNWSLLVNVPGNQSTATDINFNSHPSALYRVVANWSYTCTATRSGSSKVLSNIISIAGMGMQTTNADNLISLYPNPVNNELLINFGNAIPEEVDLLSADGKLVASYGKNANSRVDVSGLSAGIYVAQIKTNMGTANKKWVKM